MARRSKFEVFPKNFIIPLVLAFLMTTAIVLTNGFSESQDVRSRAADGPYGCVENGNACVPSGECPTDGGTWVSGACPKGRFCCNYNNPTSTPYPCIANGYTCTPGSECTDEGGTYVNFGCQSNFRCCNYSTAPTPTRFPTSTPYPCIANGYTCTPGSTECGLEGGTLMKFACQSGFYCCRYSYPTPTSIPPTSTPQKR